VKRFDPNVGVRLVSFAVHWIRAEIHEYVLRNWRPREGRHHQGPAQAVLQSAQDEEEPGVAVARRERWRWRGPQGHARQKSPRWKSASRRATSRSTRCRMPGSEDGDETYSPAAYLPAPDADPAVQIENAEWEDTTGDRLAMAMKTLDAAPRTSWSAAGPAKAKDTLHDLAGNTACRRSAVRQIEANAIKKLRGLMTA
jgi:RNA polymerase sigma-32 factor